MGEVKVKALRQRFAVYARALARLDLPPAFRNPRRLFAIAEGRLDRMRCAVAKQKSRMSRAGKQNG